MVWSGTKFSPSARWHLRTLLSLPSIWLRHSSLTWDRVVARVEAKQRAFRCFRNDNGMEGSHFWRNTARPRQVPMILILDTRDWYRVQDYWCFGPKARGSDETLLLLIMLLNNALVFVSSLLLLLFENFGNAIIMFMIEGALPIEKGTNDSWCLHCTICMLPLSGCRLQTSRNQTKSALIQNPVLFAETESAWMQNRIVGRIHMAGLSHRSRSDDAAEQKFQIPKTDRNYGEKQSHNSTTDT